MTAPLHERNERHIQPLVTAHLMKETVDEPEGVTRLLLVNQLLIRKEMAAGLSVER